MWIGWPLVFLPSKLLAQLVAAFCWCEADKRIRIPFTRLYSIGIMGKGGTNAHAASIVTCLTLSTGIMSVICKQVNNKQWTFVLLVSYREGVILCVLWNSSALFQDFFLFMTFHHFSFPAKLDCTLNCSFFIWVSQKRKRKKKPKKKQPCKINIAGVYVMHRLECTDYACWYIVMMYW